LQNRVRASFHVLFQEFKPREGQKIYITEQKTGSYEWLKQRVPDLQGSEYFPGVHRSGEMVEGIRHEDIQALSFANESLDYILTFDVLEHVPYDNRALRELFRCLRPNGVVMITVPFRHDQYDHQIRAVLREDGRLQHLMEPEYHGNPLDMETGSLCFRYFGWRLLDDLRAIGFVEPEVLSYWSPSLGYLGEPQLLIVARKSV
jgi:SAM-dependent methyltransferase